MKIYDRELQYTFYKNESSYSALLKNGDVSMIINVDIGEWVEYSRDFFKCRYSERWYAANKIPAGFVKREPKGRPYESYVSDLIIKSIQNCISEDFRYKINVDCILVSYDNGMPIESLAINAVYMALRASGVPCTAMASLQLSYVKEWSIGHHGDRTCLVCGNGFNIYLIEGYSIPHNEMQNALYAAYPKIQELIDFHENTLSDLKLIEHRPNTSGMFVGDIINPHTLLRSYKNKDHDALHEYEMRFIEKYGDDVGKYHFQKCLYKIIRADTVWNRNRIDDRKYDDHIEYTIDQISKSGVFVNAAQTQVGAFITAASRGEIYNIEYIHGNVASKIIVHCNDCNDGDGPFERTASYKIYNMLKKTINTDKLIRVVLEMFKKKNMIIISMMRATCEVIKRCDINLPDIKYLHIAIVSDGAANIYLSDASSVEEGFADAVMTACIGSDVMYYSCIGKSLSWTSAHSSLSNLSVKKDIKKVQDIQNNSVKNEKDHSIKSDQISITHHQSDIKQSGQKQSNQANQNNTDKSSQKKIQFTLFKELNLKQEFAENLATFASSMNTDIKYNNGAISIDYSKKDVDMKKIMDFICKNASDSQYNVFHGIVNDIQDKDISVQSNNKTYIARFNKHVVKDDLVIICKKAKSKLVNIIKIER